MTQIAAFAYHPPAGVNYNPSQRTFQSMFMGQLRVEISHIVTTRDNRANLDGLVLGPEFPQGNYDPAAIAGYLKSGRSMVINWKNKEKGREVFNERVDAAVQNAGKIVLEQLADYLRKVDSQEKSLQGISEAVSGVSSLVKYYGGPNSEDYRSLADSVWNETRANALNLYVRDLEAVAENGFDPRKTPEKFEEQRENLGRVLSRYRVSTAPVEGSVYSIASKMYARAAEQLFPQTLEAILQEKEDKPKSSLPSIIDGIALTLNHAWSGGMDIALIRGMAAQMLEAAKKNKLGNYIAGYIREGVGEKMEEIGRENKGKDTILKEMYENMERRGKELQERSRQLMTAYDLIEYALGEAMQNIDAGQRLVLEGENKAPKTKRSIAGKLAERLRSII